MAELTLQIRRDVQLRGGLTPFLIFIDGEPVGTLKNGKTLTVPLPRQDAYVLDTQFFFTALAVLKPPEGRDQISIRTSLDPDGSLQFLTQEGSALPRCTVSPYLEKPRERREEQALRLCMEWYIALQDGCDEAFLEPRLEETLAALEEIGAHQYVQLTRQLLDSLFPGYSLPLADNDETVNRLAQANRILWERQLPPYQNSLDAELIRAVASYILKHQLYA